MGLLLPLIVLSLSGLRLSTIGEESVGYRYFYSLRNVAAGEHPWIPQGHGIAVFHNLIQLLLTGIGLPPTQLRPRIDWFTVLAAGLPHALSVGAFAWAVALIRSAAARLILAAGLIVVAYDRSNAGGFALVLPDYLTWVQVVALIVVGWAVRIIARPEAFGRSESARLGIAAGAFAGWCLAIKPSYLGFPLLVGVLLVLAARCWRARLVMVGIGLPMAAGIAMACVWLANAGSMTATVRHGGEFAEFVRAGSGTNPLPLPTWLAHWATEWPPTTITLTMWLPLILAVGLFACRPARAACLAALPGALAYGLFLYQRTYWVTLLEVSHFLYVVAAIGALVISRSRLWPDGVGRSAAYLASGALILVASLRVGVFFTTFYPEYARAERANRSLEQYLADHSGKTLFVVPDNHYRPGTTDTAIMKGGDARYPGPDGWGSEFVRDMFPDREYYFSSPPPAGTAADLSPYGTVVFVAIPELGGGGEAERRLGEEYGVRLDDFTCDFEHPVGTIWVEPSQPTEWRLQDTTLIGCSRHLATR